MVAYDSRLTNANIMDVSFTLDDIEESEIVKIAHVANADNISVCACRGISLRENGRNACSCKSISYYCSSACHPANASCMNKQSVLEGFQNRSSDSDSSQETLASSSMERMK